MREPSRRSSRKRHISATGLHFLQYIAAPQMRRPQGKRRGPATPPRLGCRGRGTDRGRGPGCRATARDGSSECQASSSRRKWFRVGGGTGRGGTTSGVAHNTVRDAAGAWLFPLASLGENGCSSVSASPGEPLRSSRRCSRVRASRAASAFRSRCVVPSWASSNSRSTAPRPPASLPGSGPKAERLVSSGPAESLGCPGLGVRLGPRSGRQGRPCLGDNEPVHLGLHLPPTPQLCSSAGVASTWVGGRGVSDPCLPPGPL